MSMDSHKLDEVFGSPREIPKSYVIRSSVDERFVNDLSRTKHIVLYGGSKQGKSSVRKYNLKAEDCITVQCHRNVTKASLYEMILKQANIKTVVTESKTISGGAKLAATFVAEGKVPFVAKASGQMNGEGTTTLTNAIVTTTLELNPEDPNEVSRVLIAAGFRKFIVVEDFHYLDTEVQQAFAFDLKVFHEVSQIVFIIVGVWLEANRLTLYNGDLSGRVTSINADEWPDPKLREVIEAGECLLNIEFADEVVEAIVSGCQGNVGVLQEVCFLICEAENIFVTQGEVKEISNTHLVKDSLAKIASDQAGRYRTFLAKFAEGLGATEHEMYRWIAWVAINSRPSELRHGLSPNTIFHKIKLAHPAGANLQHNNVNQALERVAKVQQRHLLQPHIFDYSDGDLKVVDASFLVFLQTQSRVALLEAIGMAAVTPTEA